MPETAGASQILTCREEGLDVFSHLAAAPVCGDTVEVNGCRLEQEVCLSYQRTRLTEHSPNKAELKFSMLQVPKHHSQVKGKTAGAVILRLLPCTLLISVVKPLMNQRRKGKKQSNRKSRSEASLLRQQSLPRHRQNSQDKRSTKFIKIHGSCLPGSHKSALL